MKLMFWGLLLLFFDFNLNFNASSVNVSSISLLPDFVGMALIYVGMGKVRESTVYGEKRVWAKVGIVYHAILWVLNLVGMSRVLQLLLRDGMLVLAAARVLAIITAVLDLIVTCYMARGVAELEKIHSCDLYSRPLMTAWKVLVLWSVLVQLANALGVAALSVIALLAFFAFVIYFIVRFHKSRKAYEECLRWEEEDRGAPDLF